MQPRFNSIRSSFTFFSWSEGNIVQQILAYLDPDLFLRLCLHAVFHFCRTHDEFKFAVSASVTSNPLGCCHKLYKIFRYSFFPFLLALYDTFIRAQLFTSLAVFTNYEKSVDRERSKALLFVALTQTNENNSSSRMPTVFRDIEWSIVSRRIVKCTNNQPFAFSMARISRYNLFREADESHETDSANFREERPFPVCVSRHAYCRWSR